MIENLSASKDIGVLIVERFPFYFEGMNALLRFSPRLRLLSRAADIEMAERISATTNPKLVWYRISSELLLRTELYRLRHSYPSVPLVVLDDTPNDSKLNAAFGEGVKGYLTTRQSGPDVADALCRIASGENVVAPEVAVCLRSGQYPKVSEEPPCHVDASLAALTVRQREIMTHLARGLTVKQCAALLGLKPSTVDNHKSNLMRKLNIHKTTELVRLAFKHRLLIPDDPEQLVSDQRYL